MIKIRKSQDRGYKKIDWLESWHTFSFSDYYDPGHMGFRALRVINEDIVAPAGGFATHGHRDMEIVTYVLDGELEHKDSTGNSGTIKPGEVQRMTAGSGIRHSEFNHSEIKPVHLFQIWILPEKEGLQPGYEQKKIKLKKGGLTLIASRNADGGSVKIHQDASIYVAKLDKGQSLDYTLKPGRNAWLQLASGNVEINGKKLGKSDAAAISDEDKITITANDNTELLLFDLA